MSDLKTFQQNRLSLGGLVKRLVSWYNSWDVPPVTYEPKYRINMEEAERLKKLINKELDGLRIESNPIVRRMCIHNYNQYAQMYNECTPYGSKKFGYMQ